MNSISPVLAFNALHVSDESENMLHSNSASPRLSLDLQEIREHFREHYHRGPSLWFLCQEPKFCLHRQDLPCLCHCYPFGPWPQTPHHLLLLIFRLPLHVITANGIVLHFLIPLIGDNFFPDWSSKHLSFAILLKMVLIPYWRGFPYNFSGGSGEGTKNNF